MTKKSVSDIEFETEINAPIEVVWRQMTHSDAVPLWLGCINYDKKLGCIFYMQQDPDKRAAKNTDGATHCEVLLLDEPDLFQFSWYFPDMPKTIVEIALVEAGPKKTIAKFKHSGFDQFDIKEITSIRDALAQGWTSHVLPNLKSISEQAV